MLGQKHTTLLNNQSVRSVALTSNLAKTGISSLGGRLAQLGRSSSQAAIANRAASGASAQAKPKVPLNGTYNLRVTGVSLAGNTAIPIATTTYTPIEVFNLPGRLTLEKTLPQGVDFKNGKNVREIGLFVGINPLLGVNANPQAGAAWFATNSRVFRRAGGSFSQAPTLDVSYVGINTKTSSLKVVVDYNAARTTQLNSFNWRTSVFAAPKQILVGDMELQFRNNGRRVVGSVRFYGTGFVEQGAYGYEASFTGTRRNNQNAATTKQA
ncbi:hypothetical protein IQ268_23850 [Oculatella sp. LEGE 06141]|uniref:hypothetical protein n=1 Tax=Oculatella sp. LEGE 06141 TaxID=1828648 RepID=UPI001881A15A|nr:hypothetical protein [Oculatella sp. LEGE 06141]MBE9181602.1 hypothetical protein [Oculatella sp. LEGE 06141]